MYILKSRTPRSDTGSNRTSATDQKPRKADAGTCYEVFRNNTTAVEVVVKEVHSKTKNSNQHAEAQTNMRTNIAKLEGEIENLRRELAKSNADLIKTKRGFKRIIVEMKKQLDTVNSQELERQKETLTLQLENEKLKTLLDFKSNVITRFKKELNIMKRLLKFAMKSMCLVPQTTENISFSSDTDYEEFENDFKKTLNVKFATKILDSMGTTLDSSITKSARGSFENK
ncbi:unnamed protein product [Chilo suppressalis]|uniref:Uncharacterized protein n=1 Tax=Chilo suppressalis TaxID=168631 RepID=A0ABN8B368_CHISP|nr:unnamed protein product [Chilo suppressalis]